MYPHTADAASLSLLGKPLHEVQKGELETLIQQYPYWSIPRLLLSLISPEDASLGALYMPNPLRLQFLIDQGAESKSKPDTPVGEPLLKDILQQQPTGEEALPLFQPMHVVDYFASQGIVLDLDRDAPDKFSRQLKSFTEWLKTMKKINPAQTATESAAVSEKEVASYAEISVKQKEVITEAMAEVWAKQGNHDKAIEMYKKLSLMIPSKSAYFARKINEIKQS